IQQLNASYMVHIENGDYEAVAALFADQAQLRLSGANAFGKPAIQQLFTDQYRRQATATLHSAYRRNALQQADSVTLSADRLRATATFHVDVHLSMPLQGESTVAAMARLQGLMAERRWESGRLETTYVKTPGQWKLASLTYVPA
ncbi:MAG: nuclear transport factor 2 family protein, partial [Pseudomonadota bacterium]